MSITISSGSHWYSKDGKPSHDSDLRDARKKLLYASVTTIDKAMFTNPGLDRYKLEQIAEAAFNSPRQPHESIDDYVQRIYEQSLEHSKQASTKGTAIHDAVENINNPAPADIEPFIAGTRKWFAENIESVISTEKVVVDHDIGVAGRMDMRAIHKQYGRVVLDWKSQGVKADKKSGKKRPGFYDSFVRQLGFYASSEAKVEGVYPNLDACLSIVIDSIDPSEPYVKVWEKDEVLLAYEDFVIAAWGWHKKRDYWPCGKWDLCEKIKQIGV